ncbi:MAG: Gfo/Idh/MocA family protein [Gaiellales bacterium]
MTDRLGIAVIGAGRMGQVHLKACERAPSVQLAAVVEPFEAARANVPAGVPCHPGVEELLDAGGFDAVLIAAPSDVHVSLVVRLAGLGIPVLCEKPCGIVAADARRAADAVRGAGSVLQIGYWRRFVPALVALRERIAEGRLGTVSFVSCYQWDEHPPSAEFEAHSGGIAIDMGVHEFDQMRWLTGQEIDAVVAVPADAPDGAGVLARMSAGAVGLASLGRAFGQADSCWVEVIGTRGHAREPFMWGDDGQRVFLEATVAQLEAFAAAVRSGTVAGADGDDAIAALETAQQAQIALGGHHPAAAL